MLEAFGHEPSISSLFNDQRSSEAVRAGDALKGVLGTIVL